MNGRKARAIRKAVYKKQDYRNRSYFLTNRREREIEMPKRPLEMDNNGNLKMVTVTCVTHTIITDNRRRKCKFLKRHSKGIPVTAF